MSKTPEGHGVILVSWRFGHRYEFHHDTIEEAIMQSYFDSENQNAWAEHVVDKAGEVVMTKHQLIKAGLDYDAWLESDAEGEYVYKG